MQQTTQPWRLLVYRLPAQPSSGRVAVWREVRRLGGIPLQQSCVALPDNEAITVRLDEICQRIDGQGGEHFLFRLTDLPEVDEARLRDAWNAFRQQEYAEIAEECRTKFVKEVEFEIFRDNLTAAEAEELEADLDKIRSWFDRVQARDWFEADGRDAVETEIAACARLLDDFTERVYLRETSDGPSVAAPLDLPWGSTSSTLVPIRRARRRRPAHKGGVAR